MEFETITVNELKQLCDRGSGLDVVDVRTPSEYYSARCPQARNVPLERLNPQHVIDSRHKNLQGPIYLICKSGNRSEQAARQFISAGYTNVISVHGGTLAWEKAGFPVRKGGRKIISVDRQMRIVAGSLVLAGAALGYWVQDSYIGLSAFVGAGLVFAGVTDYCPMLKTLALMPWNQRSDEAGPTCTL